MDTAITVNRLCTALYRRGTHRLLGNPALGSLTGFLTALFLIRIAANFYVAIDLWTRHSNVDAVQLASANLVFLSAYAVWVGALASFRISLALPKLCFVDFAPHGRRFRWKFVQRVAVLRPMNLAFLSTAILTVFVFSMIGGSWQAIVVRGLIVLSLTSIGIAIVGAVASGSVLRRSDIQIMEILYLLFLVALNPDIAFSHDRVSILLGGTYCPFSSVWTVAFVVGVIVVVAFLALLLVRVLSAVNDLFRRQLSSNPMDGWYWRFVRIRSWAFLYGVTMPVFLSSAISLSMKRWTLALSVVFGLGSYLYFISHCENTLHEKWRCSLLDKGNMKLVVPSALTHVVLMTIPVLGYAVLK
jgi:hypothetical protein